MDFGPSQPMKDPREDELMAKQKKQQEDIENQRIKNMRGRGGAMSLFDAGSTPGGNKLG